MGSCRIENMGKENEKVYWDDVEIKLQEQPFTWIIANINVLRGNLILMMENIEEIKQHVIVLEQERVKMQKPKKRKTR